MRTIQRTAIELLMSYPDSTVAEMLGIRLCTLRRWLKDPKFREALREREREQKAGAIRIARQAAMNAAAALCDSVNGSGKTTPDAKALLEVLKASGAYDVDAVDPGQAIAEIMGRIGFEATNENN